MDTIIGVESHGIPSPDRGTVPLTIVLVQGEGMDANCYVGAYSSPEWVAVHGRKMGLTEASLHFPGLRSELENRGLTWRGYP